MSPENPNDDPDLPQDSFSEDEFWALAQLASDSDLGEEDEETPVSASVGVCRALILSQIDAPAALSAALNMVGENAPVIAISGGSAVFMEVDQGENAEDEELNALLGDERPIPEAVDKMASLVSKMTEGGSVALTSWTSRDEQGTAGTIVARRYVGGKPQERLPSGVVVSNLDLVVEQLLLGELTAEEAQAISKRGRWTGWLRGPGFRP